MNIWRKNVYLVFRASISWWSCFLILLYCPAGMPCYSTSSRLPNMWHNPVHCLNKILLMKLIWLVWLAFYMYKYIVYVLLRVCLHEGGGPQVGEVKCGGLPHLSCKSDQIKNIRDYMDRRVTPPKQVISPTWVPPLHVNRPLNSS